MGDGSFLAYVAGDRVFRVVLLLFARNAADQSPHASPRTVMIILYLFPCSERLPGKSLMSKPIVIMVIVVSVRRVVDLKGMRNVL